MRYKTAMVVMAVWLVAPGAALAQNVIGGTEDLEFDRPESWGMKFFASLSLLTSMGVPERMGAGTIDLGFEGGFVPQLSEEQRRIGFNGTKLENLNRSRFFGRVRGHIGLSESTRLELAYLPPVDIGGIKPNLFAIGLGRPFSIAEHWQLGARGYFQFGTLEGDITCGEDEVAAGDDPDRARTTSGKKSTVPSSPQDTFRTASFGPMRSIGRISKSPIRVIFGTAGSPSGSVRSKRTTIKLSSFAVSSAGG